MAVKKRNKVSAEFNMSSLTDIIFLLLIFFMLTSSIVTPNALNLQLPGKDNRASSPPKSKNKIVSIDANGKYTLNGAPINLDGVQRQMESLKRVDGTNAAIVISPSAKASNDKVVAVLDLAYKLEIRAVLTSPQ